MKTATVFEGSKLMAAVLSTIILAAALILSVQTHAGWFGEDKLTKSDSQEPVTVSATYLAADRTADEIRFRIKLDTHSVNLDQYSMEELITLRFDNNEELKSVGLTREGSGHHVTDILRFSGKVPEGAAAMTLVIRNLGNIAERTLSWKLPVE